ncbi:MAG: DUF6263 family protein [Phycisphaerae bacterium]|jgi:hypothetical protein
MAARNTVALSILVALFMLFFIGCAPETKVETRTQPVTEEQAAAEEVMTEVEATPPDQDEPQIETAQAAVEVEETTETVSPAVYTYKANDFFRKDYQFEQPTLKKSVKRATEVRSEIVFDYGVKDIDSDGNTTAKITIKSLKYKNVTDSNAGLEYDSADSADSRSALSQLIGQSYTIKISAAGKVTEISDVNAAREAVQYGPDATLAGRLLNDENIKLRHQILALPDDGYKSLNADSKWSRVVSSPKGVLLSKNHEKMYEVKKMINDARGELALVEMKAIPTSKSAEQSSPDAFNDFFDTNDDFYGQLLIDVNTGKVYEYRENFRSNYLAAQLPKQATDATKPDVLELAFVQEHSIELVE